MRLKDKTALVTGGAQGFGYGIAERFAEEGARVAILDIKSELASQAAAAIGRGTISLKCDVTDGDGLLRAVASVVEEFGVLDIVVNNAGTTHVNKPMLDVTEEEFDRVFAVNVKSIYLMSQAVVPHMRKNGSGTIVNIGSAAGIRPRPGLTWYNATKGAVNLVSKSMAGELAPDGIRVNAVAPVAGETPLLASFMGEDTPERRAAFTESIPLGRMAQPLDVANAALYLASDEASMLTGVVLEVDGGRCV